MLDDISLYWLTGTATSGARLYWENNANNFNAVDISIPAAITVFPGEIYQAPRSWAERAYHNLIYYNRVDKGGHFAAWEQPDLFSANSAPRSGRFGPQADLRCSKQWRQCGKLRDLDMSSTQARSPTATETSREGAVDMRLEVVVIPVSDVDRAKSFYGNLGWRLDADFAR